MHEPVYDIGNARDECGICAEPWPCRLQRVTDAVGHVDDGLALQMASFTLDDVRWLLDRIRRLEAAYV